MARTKEKSCVDCLYCKVSAKSTENNWRCFCSKAKSAKNHRELYWLAKKVCADFEDMAASVPIQNAKAFW
jgi:hypothetical protein